VTRDELFGDEFNRLLTGDAADDISAVVVSAASVKSLAPPPAPPPVPPFESPGGEQFMPTASSASVKFRSQFCVFIFVVVLLAF
jgi:hypothetical protein